MSANQDEILGRLQKTIENWTGEVTSAHSTLTHQIGEASEELHTLVRIIAARNQNGSALTTAVEEVGALNKVIAERDQALGDITEYNSGLELEIKKLQDRVNELATQAEQPTEVPTVDTDASEEIVSLRETIGTLEAELETLRGQAAEIPAPDAASEAEIVSLRGTIGALEAELETLRGQFSEIPVPDTASEAEIISLRETIGTLEGDLGSLRTQAAESALLDSASAEENVLLRETVGALESKIEALEAEAIKVAQIQAPMAERVSANPDTIAALEEALEVVRTQFEDAKQETETMRGELSTTRIELQDKMLGMQVRTDEAETLREHKKQSAQAEKEYKREIVELHAQLHEGAAAIEDERARTAEEHAVATEDTVHHVEVLEENAALKQQINERESEFKASQDALAQLREEFNLVTEGQKEALAEAMRDKGNEGAEHLLETLAELDSLRVEADEQSSDLEGRLEASQTELERRALGMQSLEDESEAMQVRLVKTSEPTFPI